MYPLVDQAAAMYEALRRVLRETRRTALLVTHDLIDALSLADRVVVVEAGRIVEDGPTRSVLTQPRSAFTARIAGINLIAGSSDGHHLVTDNRRRDPDRRTIRPGVPTRRADPASRWWPCSNPPQWPCT